MKKPLIKNKKALIITLVALVITQALYKVIGTFVIHKLALDSITDLFLSEVVFAVLIAIAAFITHKFGALKLTGKGFGTGILVALWFLIQPVVSFIANWGMDHIQPVSVDGGHIALFFVTMLLVGINEELLFRGILLGGLLDAFGEDSPARIRTAVFVSGCLFGLIHIFNMFSGASFGGALIQALANMGTGALFGAAYVRSGKNLWPTILVHAFMDALAFIVAGLLAGGDYASSISAYSPVMLAPAVGQIAVAIFALRKKKLLPLVKA